MLGDVAYYGDEDDPYEEFGDPVLLGKRLYGPTKASETYATAAVDASNTTSEATRPNGACPSPVATPPSGLRR